MPPASKEQITTQINRSLDLMVSLETNQIIERGFPHSRMTHARYCLAVTSVPLWHCLHHYAWSLSEVRDPGVSRRP